MAGLKLVLRPESFCIHRLPPDRPIRFDQLAAASWYSVTRTPDELSVVVPEEIDPGPGDRQGGWSCFEIAGPLSFDLVGVLAGIAGALAAANVSIFSVSTYNTDHILVRTTDVATAVRALTEAGHVVAESRTA